MHTYQYYFVSVGFSSTYEIRKKYLKEKNIYKVILLYNLINYQNNIFFKHEIQNLYFLPWKLYNEIKYKYIGSARHPYFWYTCSIYVHFSFLTNTFYVFQFLLPCLL